MIKKHEHPAAKPDEPLFGNLLRSKRMARGIGLVELAQRSGVDAGLLSRFEHGKRRAPESPHLMAIANGLGVPLESDEFAELAAAANHDRHPTEYEFLNQIYGDRLRPTVGRERHTVVCGNLSELVSKATEKAITVEAVEIIVKSPSGRVTAFQRREGNKKR